MQQPIIGDRYKGTCDRLSYCIIERYWCDFGSKYDSQNEKGSWIYLPANFTGTSSAAYRPMEKNSYQNNNFTLIWYGCNLWGQKLALPR